MSNNEIVDTDNQLYFERTSGNVKVGIIVKVPPASIPIAKKEVDWAVKDMLPHVFNGLEILEQVTPSPKP